MFLYPLMKSDVNQKKTDLLKVPLVTSLEYPLCSGTRILRFSVDSKRIMTALTARVQVKMAGMV